MTRGEKRVEGRERSGGGEEEERRLKKKNRVRPGTCGERGRGGMGEREKVVTESGRVREIKLQGGGK